MDRVPLGLFLRSAVFAILLPGTVVVFVPLWLSSSSWRFAAGSWRWVGIVPLLFGVPLLLWCIAEFAHRGRGTLAPVDPPTSVVRTGPYRFTRNPMYVGVLAILIGEAFVTASKAIAAWTVVFTVCVNAFVLLYEEPALSRLFGEDMRSTSGRFPAGCRSAGWCDGVPRHRPAVAPRRPRRRSRRGAAGAPP